MGDRAPDPVDHARTTRRHAGQNLKNTAAMPGLIAIGLAVPAAVVSLFFFARLDPDPTVGITAAVVAVALLSAGSLWLTRERRRVRRVEAQYVAEHPEVEAQPPTS